jgi:hypothetical protein
LLFLLSATFLFLDYLFFFSSIEIEVNKKDRVTSSLKEAKGIVRAVSSLLPELEDSDEESQSSSSSSSSKWKNSPLFGLWIALKNYSRAVSLLLGVSDGHEEEEQQQQQEQGEQEDQTSSVSPPGRHSSREAASLLLSILIPSCLSHSPSLSPPGDLNNDANSNNNNPSNNSGCPSKPLISLRYWPHLLELVVAVHHLTAAEELRRSTDPLFLSSSSNNNNSNRNNNSRERGSGGGGGGPVFHKKEITQFFVLLSLVETAPDKEWLFSLIQPRRGRGREGRVAGAGAGAVEMTWRQLKMNLTSLLTCSLLLSSSLQLKRREQQQQTETLNKGNEKKSVITNPSSTLSGSWEFIGTRTTSSSSSAPVNPFPAASMGDQHSSEQLFSFSYSVDDLLDGSAFLANDL